MRLTRITGTEVDSAALMCQFMEYGAQQVRLAAAKEYVEQDRQSVGFI